MKKTISVFVCIAILFLLIPLTFFGISASSAITIEATTGISLYEKNADERRPMASTTKIMTALVAIENADINSIFTVSKKSINVDGSQLGLLEGDKISLSDLLYMLMLKSANDAAETIAENIAGSIEAFADMMNQKADEIGLSNTHFANPHGLPNDNHYTTARELALIAAEALKNETFAKIVHTQKAKLNYHGLVIENSNRLLTAYEYTTGIKTGFTKAAGRCLVTSAQKDGVTLINVTLNDGNDWNDHKEMFNSGFARVGRYTLYDTGEYVAKAPVLNGQHEAEFINEEPIYGVSIDNQKIDYMFTNCISPTLYAPVFADKTYAHTEMVYKNRNIQKISLKLKSDIPQREDEWTLSQRFIYYIEQLFKNILP